MRHTVLLLVLLLGACASAGGGAEGTRNVLSQAEIEDVELAWTYEAVLRLRPEWLRTRGHRSMTQTETVGAIVYLDGVRLGGLNALRSVRTADVREIRYLTASEATTRFGTGVSGGVIHVLTGPARSP
jgi:hypothetical protein